jgi:hypothetical protein
MPIGSKSTIPLLDGSEMAIEKIASRMKEEPNWTPWVYSVQDGTHRVVPGKVVWCGKNYTCTQVHRVWLDDGTYVDAAPEHPFVMRDGSKKRADELKSGDSLMPLYTKLSSKKDGDDVVGYPKVYDPSVNEYKLLHRLVANEVHSEMREAVRKTTDWSKNNNLTVHHKDFDSMNAHPDNLVWMGNEDHYHYHASLGRENLIRYNKSPEKRAKTAEQNRLYKKAQKMGLEYNGSELHKSHNENRRQAQLKSWAENKQARSDAMSWIIPNVVMERAFEFMKAHPKCKRSEFAKFILDSDIRDIVRQANAGVNNKNADGFRWCAIVSKLSRMGELKQGTWKEFREYTQTHNVPVNHQVARVETLTEPDDVYCMTVVGPNGEDDRHNFAVKTRKDVAEGIFVWNSVDEDYWLPVRGTETGTKIETLAGGQNTAAVEDVAYIQKKLFAALKIPRAYLGYDDMLGSKATLAQLDIRFSRTISIIQKTMIAELNKIAIIHLYAHGFDGDDLQNFTLQLSNPSTVAQQQKLELWRSKFEIASGVPEGFVDKNFVRKQIWGLNDEECKEIDKRRLQDKFVDAAIENSQSPGDEGGEEGEEDLFGGSEESGGAPGGEVPSEEPKETPPEENAGEEPEEDIDPSIELLTSSEDLDDDEDFSIKLNGKDVEVPVKAQRELDRALYNRGRQRTHGASKTHMPDFKKMTSIDNESMEDPYGYEWMKSVTSNPFEESYDNHKNLLAPDVMSMLDRFNKKFGINQNVNSQTSTVMLHESSDNETISDADENENLFIDDDTDE